MKSELIVRDASHLLDIFSSRPRWQPLLRSEKDRFSDFIRITILPIASLCNDNFYWHNMTIMIKVIIMVTNFMMKRHRWHQGQLSFWQNQENATKPAFEPCYHLQSLPNHRNHHNNVFNNVYQTSSESYRSSSSSSLYWWSWSWGTKVAKLMRLKQSCELCQMVRIVFYRPAKQQYPTGTWTIFTSCFNCFTRQISSRLFYMPVITNRWYKTVCKQNTWKYF